MKVSSKCIIFLVDKCSWIRNQSFLTSPFINTQSLFIPILSTQSIDHQLSYINYEKMVLIIVNWTVEFFSFECFAKFNTALLESCRVCLSQCCWEFLHCLMNLLLESLKYSTKILCILGGLVLSPNLAAHKLYHSPSEFFGLVFFLVT